MAESRISTISALLRPKAVRIGLSIFGVVAGYDTISSQFELPTIRAWLGMSGALLPWWGWLLILQALFVYALFEYVRRNTSAVQIPPPVDLDQAIGNWIGNDSRFTSLRADVIEMGDRLRKAMERLEPLETQSIKASEDYQRVLVALEGFAETKNDQMQINNRFAEKLGSAAGAAEQAKEQGLETRQSLGALEEVFVNFERRLNAQVSLENDHMRQQTSTLFEALAAIYSRERFHTLTADIEVRAAKLAAPTEKGATYDADQWKIWRVQYLAWKAVVIEWWDLVSHYAVLNDVLDVHPDQLQQRGQAKVEQFPDPEAFFEYKTFWIILKQLREAVPEAESRLIQAAFNSPARKGSQDGK